MSGKLFLVNYKLNFFSDLCINKTFSINRNFKELYRYLIYLISYHQSHLKCTLPTTNHSIPTPLSTRTHQLPRVCPLLLIAQQKGRTKRTAATSLPLPTKEAPSLDLPQQNKSSKTLSNTCAVVYQTTTILDAVTIWECWTGGPAGTKDRHNKGPARSIVSKGSVV